MIFYLIPPHFSPIHPALDLIWAYHENNQSSVEHTGIGQAWSFYILICFIVLCIILSSFGLMAEMIKELEQ